MKLCKATDLKPIMTHKTAGNLSSLLYVVLCFMAFLNYFDKGDMQQAGI